MEAIAPPVMFVIWLFFVLFVVVLGLLTMLIPFFVYRIRNEVIQINERTGRIIALLEEVKNSFKDKM